MSTERINKFQPDRTLYLRGFTGFGAAASLCEASPTGFKAYGVFRDQADFAVAVIYDADNTYEHYSVKYLPDFNLSGMVLNFSLTCQGLQPIDSAKYSWIDWAQMDVVPTDGNKDRAPVRIHLWDHATFASGSYSAAQGTYTVSAPGGCAAGDQLILYINNVSFGFTARGGETAAQVAQAFAKDINEHDWSTYANTSVAVIASADPIGNLTLTNARTGTVNVNGTSVTWQGGVKFPGLAANSTIFLGGKAYLVGSVTSPTALTLTSAAPNASKTPYLASYGGVEGNDIQVYMLTGPTNGTLAVNNPVLQLSGGNSDNVTWDISLDFTALGIDKIRQAWLTFAPLLAPGAAYADTQWSAVFANWSVTDPNGVQALQCAGPGSVRVGNGDPSCVYSGAGWQTVAANNYWRGFAQQTGLDATHAGDSVTVTYKCASTHDLYLGTSLLKNRGMVSVSLDGNIILPKLDCFLFVTSEVVTRRILQANISAGTHTVKVTLLGTNHLGTDPKWDPNSLGYQFVFDYIEAAVPSDIPDALITYPNVSAALDFDTDATYKVSPQRLLWHMNKLGFAGQLNEYIGVYWWNQRRRVNGVWNSAIVTVSGTWAAGDAATITIGDFPFLKAVSQLGHARYHCSAFRLLHQRGQRLDVGGEDRIGTAHDSYPDAELGRHSQREFDIRRGRDCFQHGKFEPGRRRRLANRHSGVEPDQLPSCAMARRSLQDGESRRVADHNFFLHGAGESARRRHYRQRMESKIRQWNGGRHRDRFRRHSVIAMRAHCKSHELPEACLHANGGTAKRSRIDSLAAVR